MKKENLHIRMIRLFYDVVDELDEYRYKKLSDFGNNMYMLFIAVMMGGFFVSMMFQTDVLGFALFIAFIYSQLKQEKLIRELGLDKIEVGKDELPWARKKMFKRTLFQTGVSLVVALFVSVAIWQAGIPQANGDISAATYFQFILPLSTLLVVLIFFVAFYITNRLKIVVVEEI